MTSTTLALGLGVIFAKDEHGNRRKPVMDQPLDESLREAQRELADYKRFKQVQLERWCVRHGYHDYYQKLLQFTTTAAGTAGNSGSNNSSSDSRNMNNNADKQQQQQQLRPTSYLQDAGKVETKGQDDR